MKNILSSDEVAKYCGVSAETVIGWLKRGQLYGNQVPGKSEWLVETDVFLDFLKSSQLALRRLRPRSHRALIVDDERGAANAIKRTLELAGFTTLVCQDGFRASVEIGKFNPTVMTLDIRMPMISGFKIIEFVRSTAFLKHAKILTISGLARDELKFALKTGADAVLPKPFSNEVLVNTALKLSVEAILLAQDRDGNVPMFDPLAFREESEGVME